MWFCKIGMEKRVIVEVEKVYTKRRNLVNCKPREQRAKGFERYKVFKKSLWIEDPKGELATART